MLISSLARSAVESKREVVPMRRLLPSITLLAKVEKDSVDVICELTTVHTMECSQWGSRKRLRNSVVKVSKVQSAPCKTSMLLLIQFLILIS